MFYYLHEFAKTVWGPLRLFEYQSFRAVAAGTLALMAGFVLAPTLINRLGRLTQPERSKDIMDGIAKTGGKVPTMGGLIIFIPALLSAFLWVRPSVPAVAALIVWLGMSAVGFVDDYMKVVSKKPDGLSALGKTIGQFASAGAGIGLLLAVPATRAQAIEVWVPFAKHAVLSADMLPLWAGAAVAVVFFLIVTWSASNAVNLTDGIDGLSVGCVITTLLSFGLIAYLAGHKNFADYLKISRVEGAGELTVLTAAILGGCMAFMWHNAKPAEIYMGDLGALGLGGFIGALAFIINQPFLLVIVGGVFVAEFASAIAQRLLFKFTKTQGPDGKPAGMRIFKKTPLHHHFQMDAAPESKPAWLKWPNGRWADEKIVVRFWMISLLCGILGLATLKLR
ncbi:MAG: phospho-N-acetylmuramoyl-pentapeptide-transferase [Puniceicoccales bacterium]|nr:phospho-N-acetylmuramoyl-pentapeptide-transferase [Puniceicoccales bacterium]